MNLLVPVFLIRTFLKILRGTLGGAQPRNNAENIDNYNPSNVFAFYKRINDDYLITAESKPTDCQTPNQQQLVLK